MDIHDFMLEQKVTNTIEEEFSRISLDTDLAATFPTFATRFLDKQIADIKGTVIDSIYIGTVIYEDLASLFSIYPIDYTFPLSVTAWNIETARTATFPSDQQVTISFTANDAHNDRTVLQYRKTTDIEWQVLQRGEFAVLQQGACDATDTQFLFLFTTTYHPAGGETSTDVTLSVTTLKSKNKRDNSCQQPLAPPTNDTTPTSSVKAQCLIGNWSLDIPSMQTLLAQALSASPQAATISNVVVSGAGSFTVTSTLSSKLTFSNILISYDGAASGFTFHTDIDIDGSIAGNIGVGDSTDPSFTWIDAVATGNANTTTILGGDLGSLPLDMPIDGQYVTDTTVQYVCTATSLNMKGYKGGKYAWGYSWVKA